MPKTNTLKLVVLLTCLIPFVLLVLATFELAGQSLGANPVEKLIHELGIWGLRFLLITLAITPLRKLGGPIWLLKLRRMFGLFSFFYILMHFLSYAILDQSLNWPMILEDILKRPYITLGMLALILLTPLAITSTNGWMRRLGKNWKKLHRLIYPIAILGVWHFFWQVKLDTTEALVYALILMTLLGYRVLTSRRIADYWRRRNH